MMLSYLKLWQKCCLEEGHICYRILLSSGSQEKKREYEYSYQLHEKSHLDKAILAFTKVGKRFENYLKKQSKLLNLMKKCNIFLYLSLLIKFNNLLLLRINTYNT